MARDDRKADADGHGTNVAGIVVGVAPSTKIISLDVFGTKGAASSDILKGVDWVIAHQSEYNIRSMNLSVGNSEHYRSECNESVLREPFANAAAVGVVPVVAAGNAGYVTGQYLSGVAWPACTPGAIRVGAVYDSSFGKFTVSRKTGPFWFQRQLDCENETAPDVIACFSQGGPLLSIWAPGSAITAAGITQSGTSQAAPHVAGAIATLAGAYPEATAQQTASALGESDVLLIDPREDASAGYLAVPRLDLAAALDSLGSSMGGASSGLLAGDEDNFGYGDETIPNVFYDFAEPEDLGVFDRELVSGDAVDSWTHDFRDRIPAGFAAASVQISVREIFSDFTASTIEVDGVSFSFVDGTPSSTGPAVTRTFVLSGSNAALANDGVINVTFNENGDDIALDWSRLTITSASGAVIN